jgi:hypothetical protein
MNKNNEKINPSEPAGGSSCRAVVAHVAVASESPGGDLFVFDRILFRRGPLAVRLPEPYRLRDVPMEMTPWLKK